MRRELVDQRAMDLGPKPSTVASRSAVTPSTAPALSTMARVTARSRSAVRNLAIVPLQSARSDGKRRHQPVGAPVGDAGDDEMIAGGDAGDLGAVRHGAARSGRRGSLPMPISLPPSPTASFVHGPPRNSIVERRRPGRDIDAAHVARPAIAAAAAAFDGEGMR